MKYLYKVVGLGLCCMLFSMAYGQTRAGFSTLNGFPSVIDNGQAYLLRGFIVNTGTDTLTGSLNIKMSVNGDSPMPIENGVIIPHPVAPGDSFLWNYPNYHFPTGRFAPGQNDVVIWPTRSGPGPLILADSASKEVEFVGGNLAIDKLDIDNIMTAISLDHTYSLIVPATGEEFDAATQTLVLMVNNGTAAVGIAPSKVQILEGRFVLDFDGALVDPAVLTVLQGGAELTATLVTEERDARNTQGLATLPGQEAQAVRNGFRIYPVPARETLHLDGPGVDRYEIMGYDGRLLRSGTATDAISLDDLAPGSYWLRLHQGDAIVVKRFSKVN